MYIDGTPFINGSMGIAGGVMDSGNCRGGQGDELAVELRWTKAD